MTDEPIGVYATREEAILAAIVDAEILVFVHEEHCQRETTGSCICVPVVIQSAGTA